MSSKVIRKIQCTNKGQWTITVPSIVVGMMDIQAGDPFEITVVGKPSDATIELKKVKK